MLVRLRFVLAVFASMLVLSLVPEAILARPRLALSAALVRAGNLRAQPSTEAAIVTGLQQGTGVVAQARAGDWARVVVARTGTRGWVVRSLLSLSSTQFSSLPSEGGAAPVAAVAASGPVTRVRGTTVLLIGVDRRPGETSARADALLVLRLDPEAGTVSLLSLPRDLLVRVPGVGSTRINAGYLHGGLALQKRTVSEYLGVRIDYAAAVNFGGFEGLVDTLGGVTVNVPRRLVDNAYPTANYRTTKVVFEPGTQHMSGARALIYGRTRHADSDFGRMYRQQQLMASIGSRIRSLGVRGTTARAGSLAATLSEFVVTDMPVGAATSLLWNAWNNGRSSRSYVVDQNYARLGTFNGASVLIPNQPAIRGLVNRWAGR